MIEVSRAPAARPATTSNEHPDTGSPVTSRNDREALKGRGLKRGHPEGIYPTGDPVSDVTVLNAGGVDPRLRAMAEAFAECASNGPGADFQDLVARGFSAAEITEYSQAARELARGMIVKRRDIATAMKADNLNEAIHAARYAEFARLPHKLLCPPPLSGKPLAADDPSSAHLDAGAPAPATSEARRLRAQANPKREDLLGNLWSAYCFSLSAFRIDPNKAQGDRVGEKLDRYLAAAAIRTDHADAIRERVGDEMKGAVR